MYRDSDMQHFFASFFGFPPTHSIFPVALLPGRSAPKPPSTYVADFQSEVGQELRQMGETSKLLLCRRITDKESKDK